MADDKPEPDIVFDSVSVTLGSRQRITHVLNRVSFSVKRGELVALVGPSGCGKSTILRAALGDVALEHGSVQFPSPNRHKHLAYIPQSPHLMPWRTLLQNAAMGYEIKTNPSRGDMARINDLIHRYGLDGFENAMPHELSGGMRQRTSVIRALGALPSILLCDEPFSAVDFVTRLHLNTVFRSMCRQHITTLLVTHNIDEAIFLADRVIVLSPRPARVVAEYDTQLSRYSEDAVQCRQAPEFSELFDAIWDDLRKEYHGPGESA